MQAVWLRENGSTCKVARCKVRAGLDILAHTYKVLNVMHLQQTASLFIIDCQMSICCMRVMMTFAGAARPPAKTWHRMGAEKWLHPIEDC